MVPFRVVTIHPALVHVTIGTLPVIVLAYVIAARRDSARWTFVGDATLAISAAVTLAALALGVVSFVALDWVGSGGAWRWIHLATGAAGALALVALAVVRARRRAVPVGRGTVAAALAIPPMARVLHITLISPADLGLAVVAAFAAIAWRVR